MMPSRFYIDNYDTLTNKERNKLRQKYLCLECGEWVSYWIDSEVDENNDRVYLACNRQGFNHHEGIAREPSRYEKKGLEALTIIARREIMNQAIGEEKTKALSKYMGGGVVMTRPVATEIVETLWGDAPQIEKTKCILLCETYQLNPLAKHIHLIGYKRWKDRKPVLDSHGDQIVDWSIQMGIGATRLLAQRKHSYSYLDMTPRRATQAEIDKVFGDEADTRSLYAFVHIRDNATGAEVTALRGIPKDYKVKGLEKGNTLLNQVCIWTERQALDRQYPGEMPQDIEVIDEAYAEVPDIGKVDTETGEIIDSTARELSDAETDTPPPPAKKKTAPAKARASELEPRVLKPDAEGDMIPVEEKEPEETIPDETPVTPEQILELNELLEKAGLGNEDLGRMCKENGWVVGYKKDLKKWQFDILMTGIGKALGI